MIALSMMSFDKDMAAQARGLDPNADHSHRDRPQHRRIDKPKLASRSSTRGGLVGGRAETRPGRDRVTPDAL